MIKIQIKSILGSLLFEYEAENNTIKETVLKAIESNKDLTGANLTDANLTRANLTDANLTDANLTGANLTDANLTDANLTDANLTRANLTDANLTRANLTDADLTGANLTRANLTDANLTDANLTRADLTGANLIVLITEFWTAYIQKENIRIGCQYHTVAEWEAFSNPEIEMMDSNAIEFWNKYKAAIFAIHKTI